MSRIVIYILLMLSTLTNFAQNDTTFLPFGSLDINDGLSQGMVTSIEQDSYGFMWFATKDGLNRYDGYEFIAYRHNAADSTTVSENYISVVHEGSPEYLWIGLASKGLDLMDRRTNRFHHIFLGEEARNAYVMNIESDNDGNTWVATNVGLYKVSFDEDPLKNTIKRYFSEQSRIMQDVSGHIWGYLKGQFAFRITPNEKGTDVIDTLDMSLVAHGPWTEDLNTNVNGLFTQDPSTKKVFAVYPYFIAEYDTVSLEPTIIYQVEYPGGQRLESDQIMMDEHESIWIGANHLFRFDTQTRVMTRVLSRDQNLKDMLHKVSLTFRDQNGLTWCGTLGYGLVTYDPRIERFHPTLDGSVYWMQAANNGNLICQRIGKFLRMLDPKTGKYIIDKSDQDPDVRHQMPGLIHETHAAVQDEDGTIWIGKRDLIKYDPVSEKIELIKPTDNEGNVVERRKGLFPVYSEDERLAFGSDSAFYFFNKDREEFKRFPYPIEAVHIPYLFAQAIHRAADGVYWIGTVKGLLKFDPFTQEWQHFKNDPKDDRSLSFDLIFSLLPDPENPERYLWVGTNGGGLNRFDMSTGECLHFTEKDGLPNDVVYGILSDENGDLWMSTNKGISRLTPSTGEFKNFNSGDGLQSDEFNRNAFSKLSDGTLFFGGVAGYNHFHPTELREDQSSAIVRLTDVKLLNSSIDFGKEGAPMRAPAFLSDGMEISYDDNMITFEFASMEFSSPDQHTYQYQLEGFDPEPIMAGSRNNAVYTNLDPGDYTFRVKAQNRDGLWGEEATTFKLSILPPWWRTKWFYALIALVVLGIIILYINAQRWRRKKLEKTVSIRTKQLSREKKRSEELLRNILPSEVANELKSAGRAEARQFDQVSILFSDFRGFTGISEKLSPNELVDELNVCFRAFDRIMEKYGVEKIKTIGDAYMAAGGVPDPSIGKPAAVVNAALDMQRIIAERKIERSAEGRPYFEMRVGIHTGPVVAGIVGFKKFQYDIWGDTVNIASRMESSGEVGKVNISGTTYALISRQEKFEFQHRGKVEAKGKGEMDMYFVHQTQTERSNSSEALSEETTAFVLGSGNNTTNAVDLKGLRILLVEDNDFNVMVAQDELADTIEEVLIDHAPNGKVALEMVKRKDYDLILMDIQMPEMNGYDATRAIRAMGEGRSQLPIIAMTANVMKAEVQRCMDAGMNGFIPKPFKRKELLATLQSVLGATGGRESQ